MVLTLSSFFLIFLFFFWGGGYGFATKKDQKREDLVPRNLGSCCFLIHGWGCFATIPILEMGPHVLIDKDFSG